MKNRCRCNYLIIITLLCHMFLGFVVVKRWRYIWALKVPLTKTLLCFCGLVLVGLPV